MFRYYMDYACLKKSMTKPFINQTKNQLLLFVIVFMPEKYPMNCHKAKQYDQIWVNLMTVHVYSEISNQSKSETYKDNRSYRFSDK